MKPILSQDKGELENETVDSFDKEQLINLAHGNDVMNDFVSNSCINSTTSESNEPLIVSKKDIGPINDDTKISTVDSNIETNEMGEPTMINIEPNKNGNINFLEKLDAQIIRSSSYDGNDLKIKSIRQDVAAVERRSKRQRLSMCLNRYSPGEGGGLNYKRPKMNVEPISYEELNNNTCSPSNGELETLTSPRKQCKDECFKSSEPVASIVSTNVKVKINRKANIVDGDNNNNGKIHHKFKKKRSLKYGSNVESKSFQNLIISNDQQKSSETKLDSNDFHKRVTKEDQKSKALSGPTYRWFDDGQEPPNLFSNSSITPCDASKAHSVIIEHKALTIDFGQCYLGDDNFAEFPSVDDAGVQSVDWKCFKCSNLNLASKARCSICKAWKGGKRENFSRKSSTDPNLKWVQPSSLLVRTGDAVLISGGDIPWKGLNHLVNRAQTEVKSELNDPSKTEVLTFNGVSLYDDPASGEPGLAALDPFIARIEKMWEEVNDSSPLSTIEGEGVKESNVLNQSVGQASRMMIRIRWYFRREDLEGLNSRFILQGQAEDVKHRILNNMTSRDVVLSDQCDVNNVSAILGKTQVILINPLNQPIDKEVSTGAYICRYHLKLDSAGEGIAKLLPCGEGVNDEGVEMTTSVDAISFKETSRLSLDASNDMFSEDNSKYSSMEKGNASPSFGCLLSPRRVISEGLITSGSIKVGPEHQAVIPLNHSTGMKESYHDQLSHLSSRRTPEMVWNPHLSLKEEVDDFISEACSILRRCMVQTPFNELNCSESPDPKAEALKPREISMDSLLSELHVCNYQSQAALQTVSNQPDRFMILWTNEEKEQFNKSFRLYRESLRMISKNLANSKPCKAVVDYYYRFQLVEQFRRFKTKKREQAREMMEKVEDRMLNEKLTKEARRDEKFEVDISSSDDDGGKNIGTSLPSASANKIGSINTRVRTWFRTGGGNNDMMGSTQRRRVQACNFLIEVKERIGIDAYNTLAKTLKAYDGQGESSLHDVKATAEELLKSHLDLLTKFLEFLPREIRNC